MNSRHSLAEAHVASLSDISTIQATQGQLLAPVITYQRCGARQLSAGLVVMPPGAMSRAHRHAQHEMIVVIVDGWAATLIGEQLTPLLHGPGEFLFIPAGVTHVAVNLSRRHDLIAVEARADADFNRDVVLTPSHDQAAQRVAGRLRQNAEAGRLGLPVGWDQPQQRIWQQLRRQSLATPTDQRGGH